VRCPARPRSLCWPAGSLNNAFENGLKPSLPDIKLEEVLLLDEPTTGLDAPVRRRLRDLLRDLLTGLDWNGLTVDVSDTNLTLDTDMWLCVRPEQVNLLANGTDHPSASVFTTRIERRAYEGGVHTLALRLGRNGQTTTLAAKVLPPTYRQLGLAQRDHVAVHLAPDALHLIPRS
jgi:ABC-type Fe3+/spermidine/putrescine transport system ATPase subunit